jgi:hypothetical protein
MMRNTTIRMFALLIVCLSILPLRTEAGMLSRLLRRSMAGRVASRAPQSTVRAAGRTPSQALLRDRVRDAQETVRRLTQPQTVQRYTSKAQADSYLKNGVPSGTHFTSKANPGPPLTAEKATSRFGLAANPHVRVKVHLPPGTAVKSGKVLGGAAGYGENKTYRSPLPPSTVQGVTPVRSSSKPPQR